MRKGRYIVYKRASISEEMAFLSIAEEIVAKANFLLW